MSILRKTIYFKKWIVETFGDRKRAKRAKRAKKGKKGQKRAKKGNVIYVMLNAVKI